MSGSGFVGGGAGWKAKMAPAGKGKSLWGAASSGFGVKKEDTLGSTEGAELDNVLEGSPQSDVEDDMGEEHDDEKESLLAKFIAKAAIRAHSCTEYEMKRYAREEAIERMEESDEEEEQEIDQNEEEGELIKKSTIKVKTKVEHEPGFCESCCACFCYCCSCSCLLWLQEPQGYWDDTFAHLTRVPLFGVFRGDSWFSVHFAFAELICRMFEAICLGAFVSIFANKALYACALQASILGVGNLFVRPCTMPWDHWLMGLVMCQEASWYLLVAYYGADAPDWVVMVLNWSNMSS